MNKALALSVWLMLVGCGQGSESPIAAVSPGGETQAPPVQVDGSVVRGTAVVEVSSAPALALASVDSAATGSAKVTYTNARNVEFQIDASALVPGGMNGETLSLGHVTVTQLKDNDLKVCGAQQNQKCTTAEIRVYTTGAVPGFVNISEIPNYGVPLFASGLNATTAVTLGSPGVAVQRVSNMPANKRVVRLSDFANPTYDVTSDFAEAGAGNYEMTFVVEYALKP